MLRRSLATPASILVVLGLFAACSDSKGGGPSNVVPQPDAPGVEDDAEGDVPGAEPEPEPTETPQCTTSGDCLEVFADLGPCQIAVCDQVTGTCILGAKKDFTPCDDGDACTIDTACSGAECTFGVDVECDDGNPCTSDTCAAAGGCSFSPNTAACDDGNSCTDDDACAGGSCAGTPTAACACGADEDCAGFEDGDLCNGTLTCEGGQCTTDASTVVVCLPTGNACEQSSCDPATGACAVEGTTGNACSDGNPCTSGDTCTAGTCAGTGACECATDADCDEFEDGNACNGDLSCQSGACKVKPGSVVTCDTSGDGPCEASVCTPATGACAKVDLPNGTSCNDGDACTKSDACSGGACKGTTDTCDDGSVCTSDACEPGVGCVHVATDCGDGNACTDDSCDKKTGCKNQVVDCDDGNACSSDACDTETGCVHSAEICDDDEPCTSDGCDPAVGCVSTPIPDCEGDHCGDGICQDSETCLSCAGDCGACPGGGPCCESNPGAAGCEDAECTAVVCGTEPSCCDAAFGWDHPCADLASTLCPVCGGTAPSCGDGTCEGAEGCENCPDDCGPCAVPGNCCAAGTGAPGCTNAACEASVCAVDSFCCESAWDDVCAEAAGDLCTICGGAAPKCGDGVCEAAESCQGCPADCGACPSEGSCCESTPGIGGCSDNACESAVCASDPTCCEVEWHHECAIAAAGICPSCGGAAPTCGDDVCEGAETCTSCPGDCGTCPKQGNCCAPSPGAPGCTDAACQGEVCEVDPFCCDTEWDDICASEAGEMCPSCGGLTPTCGDGACGGGEDCASCPDDCGECPTVGPCCEPGAPGQIGCQDAACTATVCGADPFCCEGQWDHFCSEAASEVCLVCGGAPPTCGDGECNGDETCETCEADCGPCDEPSHCCDTSDLPGCSDPACEAVVCAQDPFCCDTAWDGICVGEAEDLCEVCGGTGPVCGDGVCDFAEACDTCAEDCGECPAGGDCCAATPGTPGCDDPACMTDVCSFDPYCCDVEWDHFCADEAAEVCAVCGGTGPDCGDGACSGGETCEDCAEDCGACPGEGDCCEANGGLGCEDPTCQADVCAIDPFCCETAWDQICADEAGEMCTACGGVAPECGDDFCDSTESCESCPADCGECPEEGDCCVAGDGVPGCNDATCESVVCAQDPFCCDTAWDQLCADQAEELCLVCAGGPVGSGDCCEANGTPGCDDALCQGIVCNDDPFCCETQWDQLCADEAADLCPVCTTGPIGEGDCCAEHETPGCEDAFCQASVCEDDPFCCETAWDGACAGAAQDSCVVCLGGFPPGDGDCCAPDETPGCDDFACQEAVCAQDAFCCQVAWDDLCVGAAEEMCFVCQDVTPPGTGSCCEEHETPGCEDLSCQDSVCDADPFCCETSWDAACAGAASESCLVCQLPPAEGDCCEAHEGPGCESLGCMAAVCGADPFCCETSWDATCAGAAAETCAICEFGPGEGDCCEANGTPGCEHGPCQAAVCQDDPFCCETAWDQACADAANQICPACTGLYPPGGGDCCEANGTPGCEDYPCQVQVCQADPFCCEVEWDAICGDEATQLCPACSGIAPPAEGDCCAPHDTPGCHDFGCQTAVCDADPFCCESAWDGVCAEEAAELCAECAFGPPAEGDCCEAHETPGCAAAPCQASVCTADPFCCETSWDSACADAANETCPVCQPPVPGEGDCCEAHDSAGCDVPPCQEAVCAADPFCCEVEWDGLCAGAAAEICPNCGGAPPVDADCCSPHESPGCDAAGCEAAVCEVDPFCCETAWDATCADEADELCPDCGGTGAGDCCSAHETPGCDAAACQAAVCTEDPFCCDSAWDGICAEEAADLCPICGGGPPPASDCCVAHDSPGCDAPGCADLVCANDPFCCDSAWDAACADQALAACPVCGAAGGDDCCEAHEAPGCAAPGCQAAVCEVDAFCCETAWDETCASEAGELCPDCGGAGEGDCCQAHETPGCEAAGCQAAVCAMDAFCCDQAWDAICADEAADLCPICGGAPPTESDCCVSHPAAGCDAPGCEDAVCGADPFCCETSWDQACADAALELCPVCGSAGAGDCCAPHEGTGCEAPGCQAAVCEADPFCCETAWDGACAEAAGELCPDCGGAGEGDCCTAHETPGCDAPACQVAVCSADAFCCDQAWDDICASEAAELCPICGGAPPTDSDCCAPHEGAGCGAPGCEDAVCGADPFCCETAWDDACATAALELCPVCGAGGGGDCCSPHDTAGCDAPGCQAAVCEADPFCCDTAWDGACAGAAGDLCPACGGGGGGDCCAPHEAPGCDEPGCQATVCGADPFCCETAWDDVCAGEAADLCPVCGGSPPGGGDCCQAHDGPGCDAPGCEGVVCEADSFCCETSWDGACAAAAADLCPVCGGGSGDCCTPHPEAGCDAPPCQGAVCADDPFCCETSWDEACASAAADLCPACAEPPAPGDCCVMHPPGAGCDDAACEEQVCAQDSFCCEVAWDGACAEAAGDLCPSCGGGSGDCCAQHDGLGCDDPACQATVCSTDPFCCETAWDGACALSAGQSCAVCSDGSDCCEAHAGTGCDDAGCVEIVCEVDSFCCDNSWDSTCADEAADFCTVCGGTPPPPPASNCCEAHESPGCDDGSCQATVCGFDDFCCTDMWDDICAGEAAQMCPICQ